MTLLQILASFYHVIRNSNWHRIRVRACVRSTLIFIESPCSLTFLLTRLHYKATLKLLVPNIYNGVVHFELESVNPT